MQTNAGQWEPLRQRLGASEWLEAVALEPLGDEPARCRANARLSAAGHRRIAEDGPDAVLGDLAALADGNVERIEWRFEAAGDPWPAAIPGGQRLRPRVWSWRNDGDRQHFLLEVGGDLAWLDGHFPQIPIVAGVVQLHWAGMLARSAFGLETFPRDIVRLKFQHPVLPPALLELALHRVDDGKVQFDYRGAGGRAHSQGRLLFGGEAA